MHGTLPKQELQPAARGRRADLFAYAIIGAAALLALFTYTAEGQHLLAQWGLVTPLPALPPPIPCG